MNTENQQARPVQQFRKRHCSDWYDGIPDHQDGRGPYEERTLYTAPVAAQGTGVVPELGWMIDLANAGELAAYDYAVQEHCRAVTHIFDGKDTGFGSNHEPWGAVRTRLVEEVQNLKRYRWLVRHASLGFDGAPSWNAVIRLPVFDHNAQTITALIDSARESVGDD